MGQGFPAGQAQRRGHAVLVLQGQALAATTVGPLELDPHRMQEVAGGAEARVGHHRGHHRCDRRHERQQLKVAQPAPALLELGLEQEGDIAVCHLRAGPRRHRRRQPLAHSLGPQAPAQGDQPGGQFGIPRDRAASSSPSATRRSDSAACPTWASVRTLWSSGMGSSQIGYQIRLATSATSAATGMHQQQVEVAPRGEVAPPEAADRQKGEACGRPEGARPGAAASQRRQRRLGRGALAPAPSSGPRATAQSNTSRSQLSVTSTAALLQWRPFNPSSSRRRAQAAFSLGKSGGRATTPGLVTSGKVVRSRPARRA